MKIRRTLLLTILLSSIIPLMVTSVIFSVYTHIYSEREYNDEVLDHMLSISSIQKSRLETFINTTYNNIDLVTSKHQMRVSFYDYLEKGLLEDFELLQSILHDVVQSVYTFQELSLLNLSGIIIASTNLANVGANFSCEKCFMSGLLAPTQGHFVLINSTLMQHLAAPIFLNNTLIGVVMGISDASSLVELTSNYSGLKNTGETLLAKRDENGDALILTPLRFDLQAALNRTISKDAIESPITQALLGNAKLFTDVIDYRGKKVLASTEYIESMDWGIVVKIDMDEAYKPIEQLFYVLASIFTLSVVIIVIISFFISNLISKPIIELSEVSEEISKGKFTNRAGKSKIAELTSLALAFNHMADSLQEEILSRDLLISIVSHDIPNYFVITKGYLTILEASELSEDQLMFIKKAQVSIIRSANLLSTTSVLLKEQVTTEYELYSTNFYDNILSVQEQINELYPEKEIEFITKVNEYASFKADSLFNQILINLLTNSVKSDDSKLVKIEIELKEENNYYLLSVADYGRGIAPNEREEIYERFNMFKTKGIGSGLGLYIVKTLVSRYYGEIWMKARVEADFTKGTMFIMKFPKEE
ncbi:MAG: ATP-binding protein [Candidatus Kariarchaeaceae archaeon]